MQGDTIKFLECLYYETATELKKEIKELEASPQTEDVVKGLAKKRVTYATATKILKIMNDKSLTPEEQTAKCTAILQPLVY